MGPWPVIFDGGGAEALADFVTGACGPVRLRHADPAHGHVRIRQAWSGPVWLAEVELGYDLSFRGGRCDRLGTCRVETGQVRLGTDGVFGRGDWLPLDRAVTAGTVTAGRYTVALLDATLLRAPRPAPPAAGEARASEADRARLHAAVEHLGDHGAAVARSPLLTATAGRYLAAVIAAAFPEHCAAAG